MSHRKIITVKEHAKKERERAEQRATHKKRDQMVKTRYLDKDTINTHISFRIPATLLRHVFFPCCCKQVQRRKEGKRKGKRCV
jgi:hypothetical protein